MDLTAFVTAQFLGVAAIFARIGTVFLFMPGFGERSIPVRHRLALALVMCIALSPALPVGPLELSGLAAILALLGTEATLGLWLGMTARILMNALNFAGYQIGMTSGLANALAPSMGAFEGATLVASTLMLAGTTLIFATDLHHVIVGAMVMSYDIFPLGGIMPGDMARQIVRAAGMSFYVGVSIAAPFYVMGLVLNVGLGLANRLMPTLPVFFVAMPVLLASGLLVMTMALPSMLSGFLTVFADWLGLLTF
ncbi:flagellar biosynthetic protein FliR [Roseivivax isoporae]|uniref:Flagellar biosynthesis protein n=1 Tax=Roseivivax isoporae LMG 25204 TaxID=1449351 RepID=X7F855_9RHOB|nr:flagellar biosynthetic protein FliR [Roseivivax isoporae]ETX28913.1 flagellar biosynthesis protein [Roseivivax isoporae LMG 25204]